MRKVGRFAPSITGSAHPGTLLAALLSWLDARSSAAEFVLRLEDLDVQRLRPGQREEMEEALHWLGIDWDQKVVQSQSVHRYEKAMDRLEAKGLLYECTCSRKMRKAGGRASPDGGFAYENTCRDRLVSVGSWRDSEHPLRVRLPDTPVQLIDGSGLDLSQNPAQEMGDPVVRRRDGVFAYHLVVIVDDAFSQVTRVVRGRDLATSTATQVHLHELLEIPVPTYRHHFLLLENREQKLAKLHGSFPFSQLRETLSPTEFCGILAHLAGLRAQPEPCEPGDLVESFHWDRVRQDDLVFRG